jgi:nicotinamidase-related amidase
MNIQTALFGAFAAAILIAGAAHAEATAAEASAPTRQEQAPDPHRAALVLIEFQNEWLAHDGKLRFLMEDEAQFESAIEAGREALAIARNYGLPVVHVGLRFTEGYPQFRPADHGLRAAIPKVGTWLDGTPGPEFHADFAPEPGELVPEGRNGASGFAGSNLRELLNKHGIETLYLAGFALHVCVESTMREAHDLGYAPVLLEEASAAFTAQQREHVLEHVVHHFGEAVDNEAFRERAEAIALEEPREARQIP